MLELERNGYSRSPETGVWLRSDYQGIAYSDGDHAENHLAHIIRNASDVSVLSVELSQHCHDWATLYHLSSARGNILRPFESHLKGRILEIGAGCGAISRYLGECGGNVLSLEGSPRRAAIAASRTRDLENVTVLSERFDDFKTEERFDAITLIGVLEYASMFSADPDPAYAMLKRIRELLNPNGRLFIAIENQLGLKYFAGTPEDHVGIEMYGIEGRYTSGQPQTYGRKELADLIARAGYKRSEFLSPSPDYKIPNSILTERGITAKNFDSGSLNAQNVKKDPQLPLHTHFKLERAWPVVVDNHLGLDLANSFLIAASCEDDSAIAENVLAYHFSTGRKAAYCKQALFVETPNGVSIQYTRLKADKPTTDTDGFNYILPETDNYVQGRLLSLDFLSIASNPNWSMDQFAEFMNNYVSHLRSLLADHGSSLPLVSTDERLPGNFIDAIPQNIMLKNDGIPSLIDIEWEAVKGVEFGHLLMRGLLLLLASAGPLPDGQQQLNRREFISAVLRAIGLPVNSTQLDSYVAEEARFQEQVTGRARDAFLDWQPEEPVNPSTLDANHQLSASLYYAENEHGFSEKAVIHRKITQGKQTLTFPLGGIPTASKFMRLDPVNQKAFFTIGSLRVLKGNHVEWEWSGKIEDLAQCSGALLVNVNENDDLLLSTTEDVFFILPIKLDDLSEREEAVLELKIQRHDNRHVFNQLGLALQPGLDEKQLQELDPLPLLVGISTKLHQDSASEAAQLVHDKDTHIHNLNLTIQALQGSTSWLVTAPLRKSIVLARRLEKVLRLIPKIIQRGGGIRRTLTKAHSIWKSQGVAGVIARLRWLNRPENLASAGEETREVHDRHDYALWVKYYDTIDASARARMAEEINGWSNPPLISIIMPVYNPPLDLLREAVDSVKGQLYPNWQLCLADDASTDPEVVNYLKSLSTEDGRIDVVFRSENGHISRASNSALEIAKGQFVALMDNDDLLPEHSLYWVARTIIENPKAGLIYSDEDKIDTQGRRSSPYFKSDWNEYLFRSQNMICHLGVYRRDLVKGVGQFRVGFEGAQDYDLALRCIEKLSRDEIIHIPRVLYHWRMHSGSTAMAGDEKPYAALAGVKALDEHLQRKGDIGTTELLPMGMYRVHYQLPEVLPMVSLIIPTRNAYALVKQCIDSIKSLTTYPNYEIILIDNGSDDLVSLAYFAEINKEHNIRVIRDDGPFNYSALNNGAVRQAHGELIGLINNDIEVITPEWLEEMVSIALQPNVGAVGARLWYPDDRLQHGGVIIGVGGVAGHSHKYLPKGDYGYFCRAGLIQEFSAITAACLIIKKSTFDQVDGLDEDHLKIAFNDVDFCLRVQEAGYINVWTPFAEMYHHESATRGQEDTPEKQQRFMKEITYFQARWPDTQRDYAYNPNLTLDHEDFGLAWPPRLSS
ncbi:glycosyltransferase [Pseudomonas fluorescens]|uniref:glycosyltransferase n=1 Tax=Pseudomonas fluorescens TaxID=294 RepID=UPI002ACA656D|nr:glycosyltransferase [Pseudomonas fluorescens]MDZ5434244.1 glycosyltransferase [Pseudomonas fluorescens]